MIQLSVLPHTGLLPLFFFALCLLLLPFPLSVTPYICPLPHFQLHRPLYHLVHLLHAIITCDMTYIIGLQSSVLWGELMAFLNISLLAEESMFFSPCTSVIGVSIYNSLAVCLPRQFEALCIMSGTPPHQQLYTASKSFWCAVHTVSSSVFWNLGQLYYLLIAVSQLP